MQRSSSPQRQRWSPQRCEKLRHCHEFQKERYHHCMRQEGMHHEQCLPHLERSERCGHQYNVHCQHHQQSKTGGI